MYSKVLNMIHFYAVKAVGLLFLYQKEKVGGQLLISDTPIFPQASLSQGLRATNRFIEQKAL